jgi:hypothetical protein
MDPVPVAVEGIFRHLYGQVAGDRIPGDHRVRVVDPDRRVLDPVGDHGELVDAVVAACAPTRIRRLPTLPTELICSVHSIPSR